MPTLDSLEREIIVPERARERERQRKRDREREGVGNRENIKIIF